MLKVHKDYPLSKILWYKFGPCAKYLSEIRSSNDLHLALDFLRNEKLIDRGKYKFIGKGSNIIFSGEYFDGAILYMAKPIRPSFLIEDISDDEVSVICFAGETLDDLIIFSFNLGLTGIEWAGGLPGTIGAAIRGNVGAFGGEIKDNLIWVEVIDIEGDLKCSVKINATDMKLDYRQSLVKQNKNLIIVKAAFRLKKANYDKLKMSKDKYLEHINYRQRHHPLDFPSCGSVFKNVREPEKISKILNKWPDIQNNLENKWHGKIPMGYIIKRLGLSGKQIGGSQISDKHSNFIVNTSGGKASEVLDLIRQIKKSVGDKFGFTPEEEVEII